MFSKIVWEFTLHDYLHSRYYWFSKMKIEGGRETQRVASWAVAALDDSRASDWRPSRTLPERDDRQGAQAQRSPYRNRLLNDSAPPASGGASVGRTETTGDLKNRGAEQEATPAASSPGDFSRSSRSARPAGKAPFSSSWAQQQQQQ
jgi:hypothetical protein